MKYFIYLCIVCAVVPINAQELSGIAASFLDFSGGAKASAFSRAYTAAESDADMIFNNPAGLIPKQTGEAVFSYRNQLGIIPFGYLSANYKLNQNTAAGLGLVSSGDDQMHEFTMIAGVSKEYSGFIFGASLKFRYASFGNNSIDRNSLIVFTEDEINEGIANKISGSAYGFGLDLGFRTYLLEKLAFSIVIKDIVSPVYWDSQSENQGKRSKGKYQESIPTELRAGLLFKPESFINVLFDVTPNIYQYTDVKYSAGAEIILIDIISLRGGTRIIPNNRDDEKYSAGIGINYNLTESLTVRIDYAYLFEELADTQVFSLGVGF